MAPTIWWTETEAVEAMGWPVWGSKKAGTVTTIELLVTETGGTVIVAHAWRQT